MAWIILDEDAVADGRTLTADDIRTFSDGKLAKFKIPKYIHITEVFPMTISGKVRKVEMREKAIGILGLYSNGGKA